MSRRDSLFSSVSVSPSFLRAADFSSSSCTVTSLWLTDDSFWISSTDFSRSLRQEGTEGSAPHTLYRLFSSMPLSLERNDLCQWAASKSTTGGFSNRSRADHQRGRHLEVFMEGQEVKKPRRHQVCCANVGTNQLLSRFDSCQSNPPRVTDD